MMLFQQKDGSRLATLKRPPPVHLARSCWARVAAVWWHLQLGFVATNPLPATGSRSHGPSHCSEDDNGIVDKLWGEVEDVID